MLLKLALLAASLGCQPKLWDHFYNLLFAWGGKH